MLSLSPLKHVLEGLARQPIHAVSKPVDLTVGL